MSLRNYIQNLIYSENKCFNIPRNSLVLLIGQDLYKENHKTLLMDVNKDLDGKIKL